MMQMIRNMDVTIYYFLGRFGSSWAISRLARLEETSILLKGGVYFSLYWYQWFRPDAGREGRRRAIIAILVGTMLSIAAARTVACVVPFRVRPINDPALVHPVYATPTEYNLEHWSAFPSDTAAYFMALAFGLAYLSRSITVPIVLYTLVWVCLTRVYLGIHYASDIVAGIAIGIAMVWLSLRSNLLQSMIAEPLLAEMDRRPQLFYSIAFLVSIEMGTVFWGLRALGNATIHGLMYALHLGSPHPNLNRPIDEWMGFLAIVVFLATVRGVFLISHRRSRVGDAWRRNEVDDPGPFVPFEPQMHPTGSRYDPQDAVNND